MPRLSSFTQRRNLNVWDSFDPRDSADVKLFGNANIGNTTRCNIMVDKCIASSDESVAVGNWYARSASAETLMSMEFSGTSRRWMHETVAALWIGNMPVVEAPLSDLIKRHQGQGRPKPENLFKAYNDSRARVDTCEYWGSASWEEMSAAERGRWETVSMAAMDHGGLGRRLIVPVRQSCHVTLKSSPEAFDGMVAARPPGYPAQLIWVHLEGVARMTVYLAWRLPAVIV